MSSELGGASSAEASSPSPSASDASLQQAEETAGDNKDAQKTLFQKFANQIKKGIEKLNKKFEEKPKEKGAAKESGLLKRLMSLMQLCQDVEKNGDANPEQRGQLMLGMRMLPNAA